MEADRWLTLPDDLLVDIFRRLETTAVIRCAGTCKHWRRTIIDNARCLRPRPDRFVPDLLLGFFDLYDYPRLQYVPASNTAVPLLTAATTGVSVDGRLYNNLLSSRDGFLLLREDKGRENLCLWTALTGICRVLPAAAFDTHHEGCKYVLATGYDVVSDDGDETAVWILAVDWDCDAKDGTTYQIFSSRTAAWGPVKRSGKLPEELAAHVFRYSTASASMVCRGTVSWLACLVPNDHGDRMRRIRACILSMDLSTGRTWTTEVPTPEGPAVLAVSEDGQLSLVKKLSSSHEMEVWVLVGDGQWTLRRAIGVHKLLPHMRNSQLYGFCPRSGFLFGSCWDYQYLQHDFLIGIDGSSPRLIETADSRTTPIRFPFEMDCSTYMSSYILKMKYF